MALNMISFTTVAPDLTIYEIKTIIGRQVDFDGQVNNYLQKGWLFYSNIVYEPDPDEYGIYHVIMFKHTK